MTPSRLTIGNALPKCHMALPARDIGD